MAPYDPNDGGEVGFWEPELLLNVVPGRVAPAVDVLGPNLLVPFPEEDAKGENACGWPNELVGDCVLALMATPLPTGVPFIPAFGGEGPPANPFVLEFGWLGSKFGMVLKGGGGDDDDDDDPNELLPAAPKGLDGAAVPLDAPPLGENAGR